MNITELRYLVAIMKWGSVSAAAKQMYAAQPNVSKALKNLEEEYGIRMFERSSTGMIPTEQGRHFIEQAQRVLQEVDRLDADARRRQGECAELRVALPHATYASYAAVDFLQQAAGSEHYLLSANGIAETGEIINIDGAGNRVASAIYGHKKVWIVAGKNKLAPTYDEALWRARNIAAPKNAQRLHAKTPCAVKADHCYDCKSPGRICRALTVLWGAMMGSDMEVVLVNEDLGY